MCPNEVIDGLSADIRGVQCIIPVIWATDQTSHHMIIENNLQRLCSLCTQTISQIIFTINGHSISINKLNKMYTHQKTEFTYNWRSEKTIHIQHEIPLTISLLKLSIKEHIDEQQEELCKELHYDNPLK